MPPRYMTIPHTSDDNSIDLDAGNSTEVRKSTPPRDPPRTTGAATTSSEKRKTEGEVEMNIGTKVVNEEGTPEKNKEQNMREKRKVQMNDRKKLEDKKTRNTISEKQCWRKKRSMEQLEKDVSEEEIASFTQDYNPSPRTASIKVEEFVQYFAI